MFIAFSHLIFLIFTQASRIRIQKPWLLKSWIALGTQLYKLIIIFP